ncbi:MAG: radical SAM protein [Thermoanaerobaculia bacterium]|nr:radical SAM protein [Thermoanaerobaculia bacterium]
MTSIAEMWRRQRSLMDHRLRSLPVAVLMPHSRCNCRCVMCDIWKANARVQELSRDELEPHVADLRALGLRWVVLSGGEPLMHANLWSLCDLLHEAGVRITLLSTGLLLARHADGIAASCDDVIVSVDGSPSVHDRIRNVPGAFDRLAAGVAALRQARPSIPVTARCVVQKLNHLDLGPTVDGCRGIGLASVSFLAADVSSEAFNRPDPWGAERAAEVALSADEAAGFAAEVERLIAGRAGDFASGFITESPERMRAIARYFLALHGRADFPPNRCNAPWVSTVVEADGTVRPCFFHRPLGNLHQRPLADILNSEEAIAFRRSLDVARDPVCRRCSCTLELPPWREVAGAR